jgi:hypothetical protein
MYNPVLNNEVKDKGLNVNSDNNISFIINRLLSLKEEGDKYKILYHNISISGPLIDLKRIVSNIIRTLNLKIKTNLQYTTLYLVAGYHIKKDLYNIPLLRVPRKIVV